MDYDAAYRLLFLEFSGVASVRISLTEGAWMAVDGSNQVAACMMNFQVLPAGKSGSEATNSNVSLHKQTLCVLTMPELHLLRYAKINNEYVKPFFGKGRRVHYVESYDFEDGDVAFLHKDFISGQIVTNMPNLHEMTKQSREIAEVLKRLAQAYKGERPVSSTQSVAEIHFNVNNVVKSFGLYTRKINRHVPILGKTTSLLHGDIRPANDAETAEESFSIESISFLDFATSLGQSNLITLAEEGHEWYMVPVAGRYDLFIGAIECTMKNITLLSVPSDECGE